jgi:hypothetical protein
MASSAAAMAARPGLSTAAPAARREDGGKGEKEEEERGRCGSLTGRARRSVTQARGRAGGGSAAGWLGRKVAVGRLVGCGPLKEVKVSYLIHSYFLFNSNLNSNSNLNPHK